MCAFKRREAVLMTDLERGIKVKDSVNLFIKVLKACRAFVAVLWIRVHQTEAEKEKMCIKRQFIHYKQRKIIRLCRQDTLALELSTQTRPWSVEHRLHLSTGGEIY